MKKSNKLLLLTAVLPLIILSLVHLSLYARYKAGNFVTEKQLHSERYERKELPAPVVLWVRGVDYVDVIPSDTFAVEYDKEITRKRTQVVQAGIPASSYLPGLHYSRRGDTLEIVGFETDTLALFSNPGQPQPAHTFPHITLYCRGIRTMAFEVVHVTLQQEKRPALAPDSRLILKNSSFSLEDPEPFRYSPIPYYYDALRVEEAESSSLLLSPNAVLRDLTVELNSSSFIDDNNAKIEALHIQCEEHSKINLNGANLRKVQMIRP